MGGLFDRVLPARCWKMLLERELPAKLEGGVTKSQAVTILTPEQDPPERIFYIYIKLRGDFALKSKL